MKKLLFVALSTTLLFSCNKATDGYLVNGEIDGLPDGEQVFIELINEIGDSKTIDTAVVKNGRFKLEGKIDEIEVAYLQIGNLPQKLPFLLENQKINIKAYRDSIQNSIISGSYNSNEFHKSNLKLISFQKEVDEFKQKNTSALNLARENNDTATVNKLMSDYTGLQKKFTEYMQDYASDNPKSWISLNYISYLINNSFADFEKSKSSYNALIPELKQTKLGIRTHEKITEITSFKEMQKAADVGQIAPEFSAPNPEGKMISLKESLGKVTLIDFWASWCGPCRKENPHVVALYNEFHEKGLNIIGVSLDKEDQKEKWLQAIATDKLAWTQISNLKFWNDPIAKQYGVQSIPATFLLDANGKIVAKNLRGDELKAKIAELLRG